MRRSLAALFAVALVCSPASAFLPPSYDDAPLRAVAFADRNQGVAVGDHGVVWVTFDGGKAWERRPSGTKASLRAVCCVNESQWWAVGRTERAADTSVGTVLVSADGGLTWAEATTATLPGLNVVKFFDEEHGIAAGDGTAACPSGLVATADGGKTWAAIPGGRATSWTCGQFTNQSNGVLGAITGEVFDYKQGKLKPPVHRVDGRAVRAMALDGKDGVTVGDGGRVLHSTDGGLGWPAADTGLSAIVEECLDLRAVVRCSNTMWAAGSPGSVVMRGVIAPGTPGAHGEQKWEAFKTGWNLPLHALCAVNAEEIFAVGELGAILKSADGGKTWKLQRAGGQRAAVLFAHAFARNVPLDAMSVVGGRDGYFAAAVAFCGPDPKTADPKHCTDEFRLSAAVRMAGGVGTDGGPLFPVPSLLADAKPDELLKHWGKDAEERLVRRLVLEFRMWQPEVVVSDLLAEHTGPAEQLVLTAAQKAFKLADDPKAYPEQIDTLGLKPFAPKKLFALSPPADAHVTMDQTEFARLLVDTPQGYSEPAFGVLADRLSPPAVRAFRLVSHRVPGCDKHPALTTGFEFAEGGVARRKLPQFGANLEDFFKTAKAAADQRRTLEAVVLAADTPTKLEQALGFAAGTLKKMPDDLACRTAVGLGRQLAEQGKWVPARELFLIAAAKYGTFGESNEAVRWLIQYYASGEARQRAEAENATTVQYTASTTGVQQTSFTDPSTAKEGVRLTDGESAQMWAKACLELEGKLKAFGTTASRDPAVMLSTLAAKRTLGRTGDAAEQIAAHFKAAAGAADLKPGVDLWRDCLAAELWLQNPTAVPAQPKPLARCPKVTEKPFLDGKLDDECWKAIKPITLDSTSDGMKEYTTKAYFAFDDEYLYFAVECSHPAGKGLPKAEKRKRDDDLTGRDRVDILLDLDRDYQTYYRLQIDQRGCVADDCWGDRGWNPKWFVAADPTDTGWTAEIAIPRTELHAGPFKAGSTWAMNVTRVVPGVGCRTWSGPPDAAPRPEGMGLMQFHEVKK